MLAQRYGEKEQAQRAGLHRTHSSKSMRWFPEQDNAELYRHGMIRYALTASIQAGYEQQVLVQSMGSFTCSVLGKI